MKLKSLELCGFKSFPDKTRLDFEEGFTAIVGPNGSGKSNISDAIRWVLGEQSTKNLRGQKMEDVIFLGTQSRKPTGFAKVSLVFDNEDRTVDLDSDEIIVARKYYRSGDSEYLLNGKNVLLKDISEILMDTGLSREGYAIVGQGKIDEILSSKASERRQIFEEAAGITKYKYRKKEAEKKLELAEENLIRLKDILVELENRIGPLKIQCEKAKKFKELDLKKKDLEVYIWLQDFENINRKLREHNDKLFKIKASYDNEERCIKELSDKIKETYDNIQSCQLNIERIRNEKETFIKEFNLRNTKIAILSEEIKHINSDVDRIKNDKKSLMMNEDTLMSKINERKDIINKLQKKFESVNNEISDIETEFLKFNEKHKGIDSNCAELTANLNSCILEKSKLSLNISSFNSRIGELNDRQLYLNRNIEDKKQQIDKINIEQSEIIELIENIDSKIENINNSKEGYGLKLDSKKEKFDTLNKDFVGVEKDILQKQQKIELLYDLEKKFDGYAYSVKHILKLAKGGGLKGICGTVSQLIDLESEYAIAIESALGGVLQHIVVEDESVAKKSIKFLKEKNIGRATFLPLTSVEAKIIRTNNISDCLGFVGVASNLVSADARYRNIIESVLGRTIVVDNLDNGIVIAKKYSYSFKIVTLDGQIINSGGSFTGGSKNKNFGLLSRKNEIDLLQKKISELNIKRNEMKNICTELKANIERILAEIKALDSEKRVCIEDKIKFSGEQKRTIHFIENTNKDILILESEKKKVAKQIEELMLIQSNCKKELSFVISKTKEIESKLDFFQNKQDGLKEQRTKFEEQLHEFDIKKSEIFNSINHEKSRVQDIEKLSEGNADKLIKLEKQIKERMEAVKEKELVLQKEKLLEKSEKNKYLLFDEQINDLQLNRIEMEKNSKSYRDLEKDHQQAKEKFGNELVRLEEQKNNLNEKYNKIIENIWESYGMTLSEAKSSVECDYDYFDAKKDLIIIKDKIKQLGSVNLAAILEYEEVSERYGFLNDQVNDAKTSKIELEKLIKSLTSSMKNIFKSSFVEINKNFKQIFVKLFNGGRAELFLDDYDDVLECGINIEVQPPGKIIKNLSALSGGEKAFVAIAIYFAIIKFKPSPFCILDEIEAALDDVNVAKFASYIKNIYNDTQFIVITHRRGTMEEADVLYGVTMQDDGISKLLKLKSTFEANEMINV